MAVKATPDRYLLFLSDGLSKDVKAYLMECIENHGLAVEVEDLSLPSQHIQNVLVVGCPFHLLAEEAEEIELEKKLKGSEKVQEFSVSELELFEGSEDRDTFFTPAEQSFLLQNCLNKVNFDREKFLNLGIQRFKQHESIITGCLHSKPQIIESVTPMHSTKERRVLWQKVKKNPLMFPLDEIRNYYGEDIAYYFSWMSFFTWSLLGPAAFGLILFFHRPKGITVDDSPYLPAYALVMALWTIYFTKSWRRQENELALRWGTINVERVKIFRPEFYGDLKPSPITGKPERYFPSWKRWLLYLFSFVVTVPFLVIAVGAMILSLNFNGYVKDKHSPIYIGALAKFAEPGQIFAGDSKYYGWMVPTVSHSIVINILNKLYHGIATYCTDMENHK